METWMSRGGHRLLTPAVTLVLGAPIAVAGWVGSGWQLGLGLSAILALAAGFYLLGGREGDVAAISGGAPDERQRLLDLRATAVAFSVVGLFCIAATAIDLVRGGSGNPYATLCAVGGVSYAVALVVLRRRV